MDKVTEVLDHAKAWAQTMGVQWKLGKDGGIFSSCLCPLEAAFVDKHRVPIHASLPVCVKDFGFTESEGHVFVRANDWDYAYPAMWEYHNFLPFNPFLRERLCFELIGGRE